MSQTLRDEDVKAINDRIRYHLCKYRGKSLTISKWDLSQNCWLEVMKMLPRYQPEKGIKISTFINSRVAGSIIDQFRKQDKWQNRHVPLELAERSEKDERDNVTGIVLRY
jgi:DNA-directed RNA polymerase specialized sigma subunit